MAATTTQTLAKSASPAPAADVPTKGGVPIETNPDIDPTEPPDYSDPEAAAQSAAAQMNKMLAAQGIMQSASMQAQIATAVMNATNQTVGAVTSMAVQTVSDLVKTTKDAVKSQGEAFQKAN